MLVTTDKGLCGGLNTNISRVTLSKLKEFEAAQHQGVGDGLRQQGSGPLTRIMPSWGPRKCSWALSPTSTAPAGRHQGAAGRLPGRPYRRAERGDHALRQHDEARAGVPRLPPLSNGLTIRSIGR